MGVELFTVLSPVMVVAAGALICIASEAFLRVSAKHSLLPWIAAITLLVAAVTLIPGLTTQVQSVAGILVIESTRAWLQLAVLLSALCGLAALQHGLRRSEAPSGEGYALMLLCTIGVMIMVQSSGYLALYIGLELASLATYALIGIHRHRLESGEALFKYLIMGAVFSALLAYGMALTYGATGSIAYGYAPLEGREGLFLLGQTLVVLGLLFKVGAVPVHTWAPDAYTGSSIGVAGFMAATMKVGSFVALAAVWLNALAVLGEGAYRGPLSLGLSIPMDMELRQAIGFLPLILLTVAILSLLLGNFAALGQRCLRRLMAYSGIAHAGYLLLGLALPTAATAVFELWAVWYYLIAYGIAASGLMLAASVMAADNDGDDMSQLAGGARRHPFAGIIATFMLASLAGLPPTAGFLGKFFILSDLVAKGEIILALVAILLAVVGAVYYLRLIIVLWSASEPSAHPRSAPAICSLGTMSLTVVTIALLLFMLFPSVIGAAT